MSMVGKPVRTAVASKLALDAELEKSLENAIKAYKSTFVSKSASSWHAPGIVCFERMR